MWTYIKYSVCCAVILFICETDSRRIARDLTKLLDAYPLNKFLQQIVPKPYQIVYPKQVKNDDIIPISTREHQIGHHGFFEHSEQVTFQVVIDKKRHRLKLDKNDGLLRSGIDVRYFLDEYREVISKSAEHCYYQGVVKKDDWSAVALSTCDGLRGVIQMNNETYIIQPMAAEENETDRPHMFYKATARSDAEKCGNAHGKWQPFNELHKGEFIRKLKFLNAQRSFNNVYDKQPQQQFLKLALVMDSSMDWSGNLTVKQMVEHAMLTANIVDMYYRELNIRIALTYVELWNYGNRIRITGKLRETMENFMKYQQLHMREVPHHAAHLMTRYYFEDHAIGIAIPDSLCTGRAVGINTNPSYVEPQKGVTVLSHMIAHNLGIKHDEDGGCECKDEFGCLMSTKVLVRPEKHSRMFSTCNVKDWDMSWNMGIAACLSENPQASFSQICGNKHIERGEECDCGTTEDCSKTDPCCDPLTCLLKHWAQCRTGICCHNCTYLSSNYNCRAQLTDCDVPEFCTGYDGQCPPNNYAKDGHPCNNHTGYCMGGVCPTLDKQCQQIWGKDAMKAELQCFERFNPTGNFNGHCGKDNATGSYMECLPEDIQCGLLHCSGGHNMPLFGPDKDFTRTTFSSNGKEYECKTVHGPSMLELPNLGLVIDGTKCGLDRICIARKCVSLSSLPKLNCPGTTINIICSQHGICTKDDTCICDEGWGSENCSTKLNKTHTILSIDILTMKPTAIMTTAENIHLIPLDVLYSTVIPVTNGLSSVPVVQANESSWLNTQWMMIILAAVIGGLTVLLGISFLCYRQKSVSKFGNNKNKKFVNHCDDVEMESRNKLIKFGSLPSYKNDKKQNRKNRKKGKKGCKSEDSYLELPPPPVIITVPNSARPEKGILKGSFNSSRYANVRTSSESNTATSSGIGEHDSVGPYDEIDEDTEAGEIQDIIGRNKELIEKSLDNLDSLIESSSFDYILPPPFSNLLMQNSSPSQPKKFTGYDIPITSMSQAQRPHFWKPNLVSPPKSRIVRMKNLDELLQTIDRNTIDLSPSPDDPPVQISPSTSEDVRSSSTDERHYTTNSHEPQSPNSITSGSTCTALRPLLGSQWSKYVLHHNNPNSNANFNFDDIESPLSHINIPPPMNPINIRSIFNYGQKSINRDNHDTPLGNQNCEYSSNNGLSNSRNCYEKSSGYGSEHDPERFSINNLSHNHSRSGSASPPHFSSVIRTGPNQIKLVPCGKYGGHIYNPMDDDLQKLLEGVPRIDAGCYEQSPLMPDSASDSSNIGTWSSLISGTGTLLKNYIIHECSSSGLNSDTNTIINSDCANNTMDRLKDCENVKSSPNESEFNLSYIDTECTETGNFDLLDHMLPELPNRLLPNSKPLCEFDEGNQGSGPCIDRSLEEIPQFGDQKNKKMRRQMSQSKVQRPLSLGIVNVQKSSDVATEVDPLVLSRYSAIDPVAVDICKC